MLNDKDKAKKRKKKAENFKQYLTDAEIADALKRNMTEKEYWKNVLKREPSWTPQSELEKTEFKYGGKSSKKMTMYNLGGNTPSNLVIQQQIKEKEEAEARKGEAEKKAWEITEMKKRQEWRRLNPGKLYYPTDHYAEGGKTDPTKKETTKLQSWYDKLGEWDEKTKKWIQSTGTYQGIKKDIKAFQKNNPLKRKFIEYQKRKKEAEDQKAKRMKKFLEQHQKDNPGKEPILKFLGGGYYKR